MLGLARAQALGNSTAQAPYQPQRQTLAGLAVGACVEAACCKFAAYFLARGADYRVLATVVGAHHLLDE
jgi:hypothetical protein